MKMLAFSIRDVKAECFTQPFFAQAKGQAIRGFADAVNDGKSDYARHPADYTLFHIGSFDDQTGAFEPESSLVPLGNGLTFKTGVDASQVPLALER